MGVVVHILVCLCDVWSHQIALMHKMLGEYDLAITEYLDALSIYRSALGDKHEAHPQYIATLNNLGLCFQVRDCHKSDAAL